MKKLRLLFTQDCNRNCPGCCNKEWDLDNLPKVDHFNYDEILITGGEPLLYRDKLLDLLFNIKEESKAKVYIYTAKIDNLLTVQTILPYIDGITLTLHEQTDVISFNELDKYLTDYNKVFKFHEKSFRLNVFEGIDFKYGELWKVKSNMKWIENCPLPKNEIFMKI